MLMQIATAIIARWQVALGVLGLLIVTHTLSYCTGYGNGKDAAEAAQAALDLKATQKARQADTVAQEIVKETTDAVEAQNQRAREADRGDPLADGLRSLRGKTGPGVATPASR